MLLRYTGPTPRTMDIGRRDKEVVHIEVVGSCAVDERVRKVEQALGSTESQAGSPYPVVGGQAAKVVLFSLQTVTYQRPGREIGRVEQPDARLPDECGRGEVVVVANPGDRRVRIEAPENGIADHSAPFSSRAASYPRANDVDPERRLDSASTVAARARTAPVIAKVMPAERPRSPSPFVIIEMSNAPTAA